MKNLSLKYFFRIRELHLAIQYAVAAERQTVDHILASSRQIDQYAFSLYRSAVDEMYENEEARADHREVLFTAISLLEEAASAADYLMAAVATELAREGKTRRDILERLERIKSCFREMLRIKNVGISKYCIPLELRSFSGPSPEWH